MRAAYVLLALACLGATGCKKETREVWELPTPAQREVMQFMHDKQAAGEWKDVNTDRGIGPVINVSHRKHRHRKPVRYSEPILGPGPINPNYVPHLSDEDHTGTQWKDRVSGDGDSDRFEMKILSDGGCSALSDECPTGINPTTVPAIYWGWKTLIATGTNPATTAVLHCSSESCTYMNNEVINGHFTIPGCKGDTDLDTQNCLLWVGGKTNLLELLTIGGSSNQH